jgi:hypothetical protein
MANKGLQNPTDKYPKPPYKKQSQPWPGLARKIGSAMVRPATRGLDDWRGARRSSQVVIPEWAVPRRLPMLATAPTSRSNISLRRSRTQSRQRQHADPPRRPAVARAVSSTSPNIAM